MNPGERPRASGEVPIHYQTKRRPLKMANELKNDPWEGVTMEQLDFYARLADDTQVVVVLGKNGKPVMWMGGTL